MIDSETGSINTEHSYGGLICETGSINTEHSHGGLIFKSPSTDIGMDIGQHGHLRTLDTKGMEDGEDSENGSLNQQCHSTVNGVL